MRLSTSCPEYQLSGLARRPRRSPVPGAGPGRTGRSRPSVRIGRFRPFHRRSSRPPSPPCHAAVGRPVDRCGTSVDRCGTSVDVDGRRGVVDPWTWVGRECCSTCRDGSASVVVKPPRGGYYWPEFRPATWRRIATTARVNSRDCVPSHVRCDVVTRLRVEDGHERVFAIAQRAFDT